MRVPIGFCRGHSTGQLFKNQDISFFWYSVHNVRVDRGHYLDGLDTTLYRVRKSHELCAMRT